jgi:hypothetical protein
MKEAGFKVALNSTETHLFYSVHECLMLNNFKINIFSNLPSHVKNLMKEAGFKVALNSTETHLFYSVHECLMSKKTTHPVKCCVSAFFYWDLCKNFVCTVHRFLNSYDIFLILP